MAFVEDSWEPLPLIIWLKSLISPDNGAAIKRYCFKGSGLKPGNAVFPLEFVFKIGSAPVAFSKGTEPHMVVFISVSLPLPNI